MDMVHNVNREALQSVKMCLLRKWKVPGTQFETSWRIPLKKFMKYETNEEEIKKKKDGILKYAHYLWHFISDRNIEKIEILY